MSPERGFKSEGKKSSADFAGQNELKRFFRKKEKKKKEEKRRRRRRKKKEVTRLANQESSFPALTAARFEKTSRSALHFSVRILFAKKKSTLNA